MIQHPGFDPIAIAAGPVKVHWYGLMYLIGFVGGAWLGVYRASRPGSGWTRREVWDVLFYIALGAIVGGRTGYVLFYNPAYFASHPLEIFQLWQGGMSFHGGLIGVIVAMAWFARRTVRGFFEVSDFIAPLVPLGLGAGRLGNFINQELWGRVTDVPWGVVFPVAGPAARHPSQLYEAALEGLLLFVILWVYSAKPRPPGAVSGLFLVCYSTFRVVVELFREPDAHIGYLMPGWLTMGQLLSIPMFVAGAWLLLRGRR